ncbi:beta-ketoacyl synthase N-terminal-like domain-containing protein [Photobacterium sp. DNB22_13_2]
MSDNKELARYLLGQVQKGHFDKAHAAALLKALGGKPAKIDIAVIGLGCRFSGADSPWSFWQKLCREQGGGGQYSARRHQDMSYIMGRQGTPRGGVISVENLFPDVDRFEPEQFGLLPTEAALMDPSQRELLKVVWQSFDDAGYTPQQWSNTRTGVFVGMNDSGKLSLEPYLKEHNVYSSMGSMTGWYPGRIATLLNLDGPCQALDTTCSSGLVALDSAVKSLRRQECEQAIVAGVNLLNTFSTASVDGLEGMNASSGISTAFDDNAGGMLWGEGACSLLLKPLSAAVSAGDHIYGVIKGSAVNHDGMAVRQGQVLQRAWQDAGIEPEQLDYIEAHGTGTLLGDSIELSAITSAFKPFTRKKQFCAVGSLMANIGHTAGVSGLARMAKVLLSLRYRRLPPSPFFNVPNRHMQLESSPVYIQESLTDWPQQPKKKLVGVSAFSMSKTNCHVVVEEYLAEPVRDAGLARVLTVSANDENSLADQLDALLCCLSDESVDLDQLCYTLNTGRQLGHCVVGIGFEDRTQCLGFLQTAWLWLEQKAAGDEAPEPLPQQIVFHRFDTIPTRRQVLTLTDSPTEIEPVLQQVLALYRSDQQVDWAAYYQQCSVCRTSLPSVPRDLARCWPAQSLLKPYQSMAEAPPSEVKVEEVSANEELQLSGHDDNSYTELERRIATVWASCLGYNKIDVMQGFFDYGGNSLSGSMLAQAMSQALQQHVTLEFIYQYQSIAEQAIALAHQPQPQLEELKPDLHEITGEQPLSANQSFMLGACQELDNPNRMTLGGVYAIERPLRPEDVEQAVTSLDDHHDILRTRFCRTAQGWQQNVLPSGEPPAVCHIDLCGTSPGERFREIERRINEQLYVFDLETKPPYTVLLFTQESDQPVYIACYFHHVIMDAFALKVYAEQLISLAMSASQGKPPIVEDKALSYFQYISECQRYAGVIAKQQQEFIDQVPLEEIPRLPRDIEDGINYRSAIRSFMQVIDCQTTERLCYQLVKQHQVAVIDVLIAAMSYSLTHWTGKEWVEIHNVITGRDIIYDRSHDFSQTLGLFSVGCDVVLQNTELSSPLAHLLDIKAQRDALPAKGVGNVITQHIEPREPGCRYDLLRKEVAINYFGDMLTDRSGGNGPVRMLDNLKVEIGDDSHIVDAAILNIWGSLEGGELKLAWGYSENIHHESTIRAVAERYRSYLELLAEDVACGKSAHSDGVA